MSGDHLAHALVPRDLGDAPPLLSAVTQHGPRDLSLAGVEGHFVRQRARLAGLLAFVHSYLHPAAIFAAPSSAHGRFD
jgi:hypothetical protein